MVELNEYRIQYKPRLAKKGHVLAYFLVEIPQPKTYLDSFNCWTLSVDGASQQTRAGIGLQLKSLSRDKNEQAIRLGFNASNK